MAFSEFQLVTGLVVFVATIAALCFARLFRRDAASRDATLFATILLCLCAPLILLIVDIGGYSWRVVAPPRSVNVRHDPVSDTFSPTPTSDATDIESPSASAVPGDSTLTDRDAAVTIPIRLLERVPLSKLLFYLWGFGVVALIARFLFAWWKLRRVVSSSMPLDEEVAQRAWDNARHALSLKRDASLHVSRLTGVPFATGGFQAKVVLPASWKQLTGKQLEDVLLHELMHVVRRDSPKLLLQHFAAIIYWPVITVHLLNHFLNQAREEVCDNGVLNVRDAISYGDTLLKAAQLAAAPSSRLAVGFLRHRNNLEDRVSNLLANDRTRQVRAPLSKYIPVTGMLALLVGAVCVLAAPPQPREPVGGSLVVEVKQPSQGIGEVDSQATLTVRVVDKVGVPIANVDVLLYDANKILAGLERRFDNVLKRTNARGECDFGKLPLEHVAILVRRRQNEFSESVVHLFTHDPEPRLSTNRLVQLETDENEIIVTHTMRRGVDLKFEVIDAVTKKPIHFAAIHWKEPDTKGWSNVALLDSGGQQNGTTLVPEMGNSIFRAARAGYEPAEVSFGRTLTVGEPITRRIELKPRPKVKFSIFTPAGEPASKAKVEWSNLDGLWNEESLWSDADENGTLEVRYPPHPDEAQLTVTHESGALRIPFSEVASDGRLKLNALDDASIDAVQRLPRLSVRVVDQHDAPVKRAGIWVGDGEHMLGTREGDFELLYETTDETGIADLGILPKDFVRIHVLGNGGPQVYAMVSKMKGRFQQVTPRYFVAIAQTNDKLEVTFKLTPPTPVHFRMVDADTGEDVLSHCPGYPEVFVKDGGQWWILSLFDSTGQHIFAPIIKSMEGKTFRATVEGYKPKTFTLQGLKAEGIEHTIELQRSEEPNLGDTGRAKAATDNS